MAASFLRSFFPKKWKLLGKASTTWKKVEKKGTYNLQCPHKIQHVTEARDARQASGS